MRKNISVNMVNTRSSKERKIDERMTNQKNVPVTEIDLEPPEQSLDELKRKTTDSLEEQETKTIVFSPIGDGDEIINNTPKEKNDYSQTKRKTFMKIIAAMVVMKPKEKEEVPTAAEKSKTFGAVSTVTTEVDQGKEQPSQEAAGHQNEQAAKLKKPLKQGT